MLAIHAGADALGLVGKMPSGPGPIKDDLIAAIAKTIYPPVSSFLLTSEQSAKGIIDHLLRTHVNTVQIVDELTEGTYRHIRNALPHLRIVQVIHVTGGESIIQALNIHEMVDAILLDSGNPKATLKTLGGTGNTHNWNISRKIVEAVSKPVFLAGGLRRAGLFRLRRGASRRLERHRLRGREHGQGDLDRARAVSRVRKSDRGEREGDRRDGERRLRLYG